MWKNDKQACETIIGMLQRARMDHLCLWNLKGPTDAAVQLLSSGGLSHGELIMLRVAFDLWGGAGHADLADIIGVLDTNNLRGVLQAILVVRSDLPWPNTR